MRTQIRLWTILDNFGKLWRLLTDLKGTIRWKTVLSCVYNPINNNKNKIKTLASNKKLACPHSRLLCRQAIFELCNRICYKFWSFYSVNSKYCILKMQVKNVKKNNFFGCNKIVFKLLMSIKAASKGNHFTLGAVDFHESRIGIRGHLKLTSKLFW